MQVRLHLGTLYVQQGRYADGEAALQRALELDPGNRYALSMLAHARQQRCDWGRLDDLFAQIERALEGENIETEFPCMPFATLAMPLSALAQLHAAQRWSRTIARRALRPRKEISAAPVERLRVAFATWNVRDHPTMHPSLEFWEKIDRSRLEMFAYSLRADVHFVGEVSILPLQLFQTLQNQLQIARLLRGQKRRKQKQKHRPAVRKHKSIAPVGCVLLGAKMVLENRHWRPGLGVATGCRDRCRR